MVSPPDEEKTDVRLTPDAATFPCLEIVTGPKGGGRSPLKVGKNSIGRSRENDIVLDDSSVSRRHAVLEVAETGASIADLGSRNGTKVQGQKIGQAVPLAHDARIKIGLFQLRFLTQEASPVVVGEEEPLPPAEPAEEEAEFPEPPPEEPAPVTPPKAARSYKWLLYLFLGAILVVALVVGGSRAIEYLGLFGAKKEASRRPPAASKERRPGRVGGVLPADKVTIPPASPEKQPLFLDFSSTPIPAQVFFGTEPMGVTPFRLSTTLMPGKWYEARAVFQMPEIGEVVEEKAQFSLPAGATLLPVNFSGKIGIFKVASLPRDAQLYLEGYFEKDPYRAKPIKFAEVVFGKPVYVPFGRYILELRRSRQLGGSQTYLDEVVYRREFYINSSQTTFTVEVNEGALKIFPVQITSIPPGAAVFIDDKEVGTTPYSGSFPVGEHLLTMKREGYFDFVQMIKMEINMPYTAEIQMKTSEAGEFINRADLLIKEDRFSEALPVLVEAFSKKPSPRETAQISYMVGVCYLRQRSYKEAGDYFLKAMQHDDYKYAARLGIASLTFEQGDAVKALQLLVEVLISSEDPKIRADGGALFQKISPLRSVIYITSEPAGGRVFVNGTEISQQTPLILHDLGVGSYNIRIRKEGYEETEMKLNLGVSEFRPVVAKLKRSGGYVAPETRGTL